MSNSQNKHKLGPRAVILASIITTLGVLIAALISARFKTLKPIIFTGRVIDSETGKKIHNAQISLEYQGAPPVLFSDDEGIFTFPIKDDGSQIHIKVEAKGYENFDLRILPSAKDEIEDIRLKKSDVSIEEGSYGDIKEVSVTTEAFHTVGYIGEMAKIYNKWRPIAALRNGKHSDLAVATTNGLVHLAIRLNESIGEYRTRSLKHLGIVALNHVSAEYSGSLLECILDDKIQMSDVLLDTQSGSHQVELQVTNKTQEKIFTRIPKGVIFSPLDLMSHVQSLAVAEDSRITLEPLKSKHFILPAYCVLKTWANPIKIKGSTTLLRIADVSFINNSDAWKAIGQ